MLALSILIVRFLVKFFCTITYWIQHIDSLLRCMYYMAYGTICQRLLCYCRWNAPQGELTVAAWLAYPQVSALRDFCVQVCSSIVVIEILLCAIDILIQRIQCVHCSQHTLPNQPAMLLCNSGLLHSAAVWVTNSLAAADDCNEWIKHGRFLVAMYVL